MNRPVGRHQRQQTRSLGNRYTDCIFLLNMNKVVCRSPATTPIECGERSKIVYATAICGVFTVQAKRALQFRRHDDEINGKNPDNCSLIKYDFYKHCTYMYLSYCLGLLHAHCSESRVRADRAAAFRFVWKTLKMSAQLETTLSLR